MNLLENLAQENDAILLKLRIDWEEEKAANAIRKRQRLREISILESCFVPKIRKF
jgi:hypothetical protein